MRGLWARLEQAVTGPGPRPLAGVRVVELGQNLAGPVAGQILAHLGASVVKVERPGRGDDARGWGPPFVDGDAPSFHAVNQSKCSIVLDLEAEPDRALLEALLGEADVLVQNLRPGALERLALGPDALRARHPSLVVCSLRAYGGKGPMRDEPGYEPIVQAFETLAGYVTRLEALVGDPQERRV